MNLKIGTMGTMQADFAGLKVENGCLIVTMAVTEGVKWEVVSESNYGEIWKILIAAIRPSILWYMVSGWAIKGIRKTS